VKTNAAPKAKRSVLPRSVRDRASRAKRSAIRGTAPPAVILTAGIIAEAAHMAPGIPYGWVALGGVTVLRVRGVTDAVRLRRAGGKVAERRRRKYQGTASRSEISGNLSPRAASRRTAGIHTSHVVIGDAKGRTLAGSAEDTYILIAPPRTGKSGLLGCWISDAPGAVLATSTRTDLYANTAVPRSAHGPIWVLNPDGDGGIPSTLSWSPVRGCENPAVAMQRAGYLINAAPKDSSGKDAWWDHQSKTFLQYLLHAAALIPGATIWEVRRWAAAVLADPTPLRVLATHANAAPGWGDEIAAMAERMNTDENYGGYTSTGVMTALAWLSDPAMAAAACPAPGTEFDAERFVRDGTGTIYLIGADKPHGSLAPYFATFTAHLFETAKRVASSSPRTRLPRPLTLALDEAPITCPVPLHKWMSESGGHGVTVMASIQALSQLRSRWGDQDGQTIFTNATVKVIFGGETNHQDLEAISAVCGPRDTWDHVKNPGGGKTRQPRQERAVPPERIRMLAKFEALVLHRSTRPVFARVTPVWERRGYCAAPLGPENFPACAPQPQPAIEAPHRQAIPMPAVPVPPAVSDGSKIPSEARSPQWLQEKDPVTAPSASATS
jgi:type IV secretory pathway TraG/TraD family ATPase VirD4